MTPQERSRRGVQTLRDKYGPDWAKLIGKLGSPAVSHEKHVAAGLKAAKTTRRRYGVDPWKRAGELGRKYLPPSEVGFAACAEKYGPDWRGVIAGMRDWSGMSARARRNLRAGAARARAAQTPEQHRAASILGGQAKAALYGHGHYVLIGRRGALARDLHKLKLARAVRSVSLDTAFAVLCALPRPSGEPSGAAELIDSVTDRLGSAVSERQVSAALSVLIRLRRAVRADGGYVRTRV